MAMTTATLATFEAKTIGRQELRRGRRTVYIRTYDVPYESSPPLPEAGDFLPGEASGACVTADGVTITPVDNKTFKGLRITIVAQQPVYNDISTESFDLGAYFVEASPSDDLGQTETSVGNSQYNTWTFEVPAASWAGLSHIPDRGDSTPAALGSSGVVLSKVVDRDSSPGFVICKLVTGWTTTYFGSLTHVSTRSVAIRKPIIKDTSGTVIVGPVMTSAATREKQRYVLAGEEEDEATYLQITVTSILTAAQLASVLSAFAGKFGQVNNGTVTFKGLTFVTNTVKFTGYGSEEVDAQNSPTGTAATQVSLVFLAAPTAWPLKANQHIEELKVIKVTVVKDGDDKGTTTVTKWVRESASTEKTIRTAFGMGTALGFLP